jgi:hypothetical protein
VTAHVSTPAFTEQFVLVERANEKVPGAAHDGTAPPFTLAMVIDSEAELGETYCGLRALTDALVAGSLQLSVTFAVFFQLDGLVVGVLVGAVVGVATGDPGTATEPPPPPPHPARSSVSPTSTCRVYFTVSIP